MAVLVIVPAAGSGSRFGGDIPKQFVALAGKPILQHVVERFLLDEEVSRVIVPIAEMLVATVKPMPRVKFVAGGSGAFQLVATIPPIVDSGKGATSGVHTPSRASSACSSARGVPAPTVTYRSSRA